MGIVACASRWAKLMNASVVYLASDKPASYLEVIKGYVRRHLPSATIVTLTDFEAYVVDRKLTHEAGLATSNGHLKISHLAESLLLGRGRVCVGSPRSTFSKIATTWW